MGHGLDETHCKWGSVSILRKSGNWAKWIWVWWDLWVKHLPYTPRKQSIGSSHSELPHIPWSTEQKLQESHEIDGLKKFVVNRWSDVCWVLPWKGRGRGSGKASWMSWVLNCRGSDWGGAGRKVMAEYSWKGKREKKRQSRVGNGFMTFFFFFLVLVLLFWFYYFSFNTVLTWKIVGVSKVLVLYRI